MTAQSQDSMIEPIQVAFRTVAKNCGLGSAASRRLRAHPMAAEKICSLARTAPEYQRFVIERLLAGEKNPFSRIASTLLVNETVGFYEVNSRLGRAVGMVRKEAEYLDRQIASGVRPDRLPDRLLTLDLIAEHSGKLSELLAAVEIRPDMLRKGPTNKKKSDKAEDKLNAPGALGLIAKNVFNVPVLQPGHLPNADEKQRAISLSEEARRLAITARDAARRAFGRADDDCRVRPRTRPVRRVITHSEPDGDAIAAAWLAERYLFAGESIEVLFVPRERVLGAYRPGDCLVDVGNTHDPANLFFDHKPPALPSRHDSCAAKLVWMHLLASRQPVDHLEIPIHAVFAGDSARHRKRFEFEYRWSKSKGLHATLDRARATGATDAGVYRAVRRWLDRKYQPGELSPAD